jgi:hypothetical protein
MENPDNLRSGWKLYSEPGEPATVSDYEDPSTPEQKATLLTCDVNSLGTATIESVQQVENTVIIGRYNAAGIDRGSLLSRTDSWSRLSDDAEVRTENDTLVVIFTE